MDRFEELVSAMKADEPKLAELVAFLETCNAGIDVGAYYWSAMAEDYLSNPTLIRVTDQKYGPGASAFLGQALKAYLETQEKTS